MFLTGYTKAKACIVFGMLFLLQVGTEAPGQQIAGEETASAAPVFFKDGITTTFSIAAADPETGVCGAAVASKFPGVGKIVPYARGGVGAFCTQWAHVPAWGQRALDLLADGQPPEAALADLLSHDKPEAREFRQLGIVDMQGRAAVHNPTKVPANVYWGAMTGRYYTCQGGLITGRQVIVAAAQAYEETQGSLADRLMAALLAGDRAGGDLRGRHSAGLRVAKAGVEGYWLELYVTGSDDAVIELARKYSELKHDAKGDWPGGKLPFKHPSPKGLGAGEESLVPIGDSGQRSEVWQPSQEEMTKLTTRDPSIPHGTVHTEEFLCQTTNITKKSCVWTPPEYEKSEQKYPVLYLLHGSNDDETGWKVKGSADNILDNMLAKGKMIPMIVVMPNGFGGIPPDGVPASKVFEDYFIKDVMRTVESRYRIIPDREHRAIAGFSMGGNQSLDVGLSHLHLFSSIGNFSGGLDLTSMAAKKYPVLKDAETLNSKLKLFYHACGKDDYGLSFSFFKENKKLVDDLTDAGVRHIWREMEGGHVWPVWKQCLVEILPLLSEAMQGRK